MNVSVYLFCCLLVMDTSGVCIYFDAVTWFWWVELQNRPVRQKLFCLHGHR